MSRADAENILNESVSSFTTDNEMRDADCGLDPSVFRAAIIGAAEGQARPPHAPRALNCARCSDCVLCDSPRLAPCTDNGDECRLGRCRNTCGSAATPCE